MLLLPVRHGETEWNVLGREMGHLDSPLTPCGVGQARALGRRLGEMRIDALYSSDLGRAVQTAEILGAACGRAPQADPGLRERHMGEFEGLTRDEVRERYPEHYAAYQRTGVIAVVPGGESTIARSERSARVLTSIAERHPDETVAVVTHGGFLMGFLEWVMGLEPGNGGRFRKQNASFNAFDYVDSKWTLRTWNDVSHLAHLGSMDDMGAERHA